MKKLEWWTMHGPDTAYVQPNFEILVPRSASWAVRWELGQFAVLDMKHTMNFHCVIFHD